MTLLLLNAARRVVFLVTGTEKADAVRRICAGDDLPALRIAPTDGDVVWMIDRDAAGASETDAGAT